MLANTLLYLLAFSFVAGFVALLVLGRLLLALAIWPNLFKRPETQDDAAGRNPRHIHPFNWYGRLVDSN